MSLQFLVYASPLYLLLWSSKIKHGIKYGGLPSLFLHMSDLWWLSENTKDPFQHVKPALEFRPHHRALQRNFHVSQGSKGLHMKDPLCAKICTPQPCSSDVPHSGTLLCCDSHIVTESYGSNQACSVYAWSLHQWGAGHYDCHVSYATPLRVTGDDLDQPEMHRIHCGVSCATRTKTMMTPRQSWEGCPTRTALLRGYVMCSVWSMLSTDKPWCAENKLQSNAFSAEPTDVSALKDQDNKPMCE